MESRSFYLKKEVRKAITDIENILEQYNNEELELILKKIKKNRDDLKVKGDLESISSYAERIFELCPECNCIPVAIEYVEGNCYSIETELNDILKNIGEQYSFNEGKYIIPYTSEDMTFGDWEKLLKIWKIMIRFSSVKEGRRRGEYNEYKFSNLYVYSKEKKEIEIITNLDKEQIYDY